MLNPQGFPIIGSVWQEVDPRFNRTVEVVHGFDTVEKKCRIKSIQTGRITWARAARFDGKRGGYRFVAARTETASEAEAK